MTNFESYLRARIVQANQRRELYMEANNMEKARMWGTVQGWLVDLLDGFLIEKNRRMIAQLGDHQKPFTDPLTVAEAVSLYNLLSQEIERRAEAGERVVGYDELAEKMRDSLTASPEAKNRK